MPKNRKLQNIIGTEHITDAAETAIAAQASVGATVAFKNVAVSGQDNVVADAATDTLTLVGGTNVTITTDASADSVTINAAGGGGGLAKGVGAGILNADPFANNSSYQSAYPLWANTSSTNGTGWSGYPSTTEMHMIPFQVPVDGDLVELSFKTAGSFGPFTTYWAIYGVGDDNLPVGAPLFNTTIDISSGTEYEFTVTGVTGKNAGDLLYFAYLGVTNIATITMNIGQAREGGFNFIFPRQISGDNLSHLVYRQYTILKVAGVTAGTFPTIAANYAFDNTVSNNFLMNIGARYS